MKPFFVLLFLFAAVLQTMAQNKTLKALKTQCDSLTELEQYAELGKVASSALKIVPEKDIANLSLFNYYLGASLERLTQRDSAIYYHETALKYALEGNIGKRIRVACQRLLYLYHSAGNEQKATPTALTLHKILDTTKSEIAQYEMLSFLANYYNERSAYEKNIQYLLKSISIQKRLLKTGQINDSSDIGVSLLNVAKSYIDMQQPEKAIEYILPAQPYLNNYQTLKTYFHKNYLDALLMLNSTAAALQHYDTINMLVKIPTAGAFEWSDKISADLQLSAYYLKNKDTDSALIFVSRANELKDTKASEYMKGQIDFMTAKVLLARKEYDKAIPLLKSVEAVTRNASLQVHVSLLETLAQAYAATGQWENAYLYYEKYAPLRDSLYTESSKRSIAEAEAAYQNKEKRLQIATQNLQLKNAARQRLWLLLGLGLAALSALLLFVIYRNKKRAADIFDEKNKQLHQLNTELNEANRTKAKLFSIIGHDLRSPINQVYQFLKLQQLNPHALSELQKAELNNKIQTATGSLLETMEDLLLWSKTQMNAFETRIEPVNITTVIMACRNLLQLNSDAKHITYEIAMPETLMVQTDANYLHAIIRNLLQNAIKACPDDSLIHIEAKRENKKTVILIQNEGKTFTQQQYEQLLNQEQNTASLSGLGLRLVDELSKKVNTVITFHNNKAHTQVRVELNE